MNTIKAKYITADSVEAAETEACNYFGCNQQDLHITAISDTGPCTILAIYGLTGANMDAFFSLFFEPDGVYLELYERRGLGKEIDSASILSFLKRKNVSGFSIPAVQSLAERRFGREKIAGPQQEAILGEDVEVTVATDEREATIKILAPEPGGASLSVADVKKKLAENGVTHGIMEDEIEKWLAAKIYDESHVAARAIMPIDGDDGQLIFHFSTEERTGKPVEVDAAGRVDYRTLDLYVSVSEGQLLATRTLPTQGTPGITVRGNEIKQKPGRDVALPRGKNVEYNEDRTEMKSACSGMVEFINNTINVSNVYEIKGDCDISTGNVDFDGSVLITGSVRTGSTVKATNGVSIGGSVESATIIAGGNVEIKGGMQGADKGYIEAGGAVSVMFVERGRVSADGPITVDVSIHSTLESGSDIHALGNRGAIIGGTASAAGDIIASYIGALSNTRTSVEVGFLPRKRARLEALERDIQRLNNDQVKLSQLEAYLAKTKGTMDAATWEKLHISGIENKKLNSETLAANQAEIQQLHKEIENATKNKVHVFEAAYSGSNIKIGNASYKITDDLTFATFKYSNGEIVYGVCEKNKADYKKK